MFSFKNHLYLVALAWHLLLDAHVEAVENQTTTGFTTTPAPSSDDEGLKWWAILLIVLGSAVLVVLIGLGIYQTVVAQQIQNKMKSGDTSSGSGAYVKVIQVDLVHA